jgi:hypothetical protein
MMDVESIDLVESHSEATAISLQHMSEKYLDSNRRLIASLVYYSHRGGYHKAVIVLHS